MSQTQPRRFLRLAEVKHRIGLGRSTIYALIQASAFPRPYPLGARAVGFLEAEIDDWIASRIKAAGGTA